MITSKFIRLYKTINEVEKRQLKKWIYSPIHNQRDSVQKMFEFLFTRDSLSKVTLKKQRAFAFVFPKQSYDMYVMNHVISYAYKVLEEFIEYLEAVSSKYNCKKNQIKAYTERKLPKKALQIVKKTVKGLQYENYRHGEFYLYAYQLEAFQFDLEGTQNRTKDNNLAQIFQHLSNFFVITTLRYACIAATHANVYKIKYDIPMLEEVLKQSKTEKASSVAKLYYFAYMALTNPVEEDYYVSLKQYFEEYGLLLPQKERRGVLLLAINYAIKRSHTGALFYIQEALDLYKNGLDSLLLLEEGRLSQFAYKNIVALSLKLKDFDWTARFIKNYSNYLPVELRQNYKHYVTAKWCFAVQNYEECMHILLQVEYDDLFMNIDAKMMLLKMYYESQSFDALEALTQSFTTFLYRKEVMSYHKKNYLNIIHLTKKILNTASFEEVKKKKLEKEIENTDPLTEKTWLLLQFGKL